MKHVKEKRSRFWVIPVCIIAVSVLLTAAGLPFLWAALNNYETATPLHGIHVFFDRLERGDLTLADDAGFEPSVFATKQMYVDYLREQFGDVSDGFLYARIEETTDTDTACRYDIYKGKSRLGTLRMTAETPNGPWKAHATLQVLDDFTITAPSFVAVSVNGVALDGTYETARETDLRVAAVTDFLKDAPETVTYTVSGLLKAPDVTAVANGVACTVAADGQRFTVTAKATDAAPLQGRMQQVAHLYANYISKDAAFSDLTPHLIKNSPFYKSAKAYNNYWYNNHLSVEFANEVLSDIEMLSADVFAADISFDYIVKRTHDTNTYPTAYRCLFVKAGNSWQLLDLKMQ